MLNKLDNIGYINSKQIKQIQSKKIYYSVCLWGKEYIDIFNEVLIPSLLQNNNIPKLKKYGCVQKIFIFTKDNEYPLTKITESKLKKFVSIEIIKRENIGKDIDPKIYLKDSLITFIQKSLDNNAYSMVLTPDHIYGNKSVFNLFVSAYGKDIGIACIGARINWKKSHQILKKIFKQKKILENRLVNLTFRNLHPAFKQSINIKSSYIDSLTIEEIYKDTFIVSSSRVNVCIVKFQKSDLKFFQNIADYNNIDFYWPELLIKEGRYKFIGDSDLIFYSELTKENLKFQKIDKNKVVINYMLVRRD